MLLPFFTVPLEEGSSIATPLFMVQALGLTDLYKNDPVTQRFIHKTVAPVIPEADEFLHYFKATWLDSRYAPRTWNYHQHEGPRTNHHLEGWYNRLKSAARKAHPNLYEFIGTIQR